jgi:SAM-dependent methyltransferase
MALQARALPPQRVENDFRVCICPFCEAPTIENVGGLKYANKIIFADTEIELQRRPELWRCSQCHSGFTQNAIPEESAARMYGEKTSNRWESPLKFAERRTDAAVRRVRKLLRQGSKVLDVGCSSGQFLDFAAENGCETFGVEYSDNARKQAIASGHTCFREIAEVPAKSRFDSVFLFDVIEHVYHVPEFLREHAAGLVPGGLLVILSGNIGSLTARILKNRWWYCRYPEHVRFPSLKYLANLHGFKLLTATGTYALRTMEVGIADRLSLAWKHLRQPAYDGKPPLLPDHYLIVLQRTA